MPSQQQENPSTDQHEFLSTLASGLPAGSYFHLARAIPKTDGNTAWENDTWREQHLDGHWYFCTGASSDSKHRRAEDMVAVLAIVLDDVKPDGTGKGGGVVEVEPTWKLETSPGNEQWGYMLKVAEPDIGKADALMVSLIEAGLQDPGVNRSCRVWRVPGSINQKPQHAGFKAVLRDVEWGRTFTLNSLAKAFKVRPGAPIEPRVPSGERPGAGKPDPFLDWMAEQGMLTGERSSEWLVVACPFSDEHTDPRATAKYLPTFASEDGRPRIECWHTHGRLDKAAFAKRFFAWAAEQGAPPPSGPDPEKLREMFAAIRTGPYEPQAKRGEPVPLQPGATYDEITLDDAFGKIPISALHDIKYTKGSKAVPPAPAAKQDTSNANVLACMRHLGVESRLNLMNGETAFLLPERIDPAGFGSMSAYQIDSMVHGAVRDALHRVGLNKAEIDDNMTGIAERNCWHPAKDWIESKPWDGQDRLEHLLRSVETPTPDLFKAYFRRWALQTVEAACGWAASPPRREQEKALCLVLAGHQGVGKTRWLMSLAPEGFTVRGKHLSLDGSASAARDSIHEALQGWIVELGELDTTFGKSANGSLKAFLSNTTDQYRLPYAEAWGRRPRCTSFCASVNDAQFLKDDTGSRRYIVIWTDHCDVDHATDMQQLWAQMHTYWKGGEQTYLTKAEERMQAEGNARHQAEDPVADAAANFAEKRAERSDRHPFECSVKATDVLQMLNLRMDLGGTSKRVGAGLRLVLGKPQQLDKRGGHKLGWRLWLDKDEVKVYGKMLRPSKA
jgi:hypothetical protein